VKTWISFLKFGSLSGLGWALDFAILMLLVAAFGASAAAANVVSSSVAALTVFLVSRRLVFARAQGGLAARVAVYFLYTFCMIGLAAAAMGLLVEGLNQFASSHGWSLRPTVVAAAAKVIVTPPLLILNFLVARVTAERALPRVAAATSV